MTPALSLLSLSLLLLCVLTEIGYQISFKHVAIAPGGGTLRRVLMQPLLWLGISLWLIEVVCWIAVLRDAPMAVAYPVMALTYAGVPAAGMLFLKERMSASQLAGAGLVLAGVVAVSMARG